MIRSEAIRQLGVQAAEALKRSFEVYTDLGERGLEKIQKNQFGDKALLVDIACENAVLDSLDAGNVPVVVMSEEHGRVVLGDNPQYVAVLDGIDGSNQCEANYGKAKYGTMFGLFLGTNPCYQDYLVGGIMEHATGSLYLAVRGKGTWVTHVPSGIQLRIHTSNKAQLDHQSKIFVDDAYWPVNKVTFTDPLKAQGFDPKCLLCSCMYYATVSEGKADLALECTRKGNLEIAAAYGLIAEAGGVMVDLEGHSIGPRKYLEFGQAKNEFIPVITAANASLAQQLVDLLKKS